MRCYIRYSSFSWLTADTSWNEFPFSPLPNLDSEVLYDQGFRESSSGLPKRAARRTCIPPEGDRCRCETKGTACGTLPSLHFYGERRTIIASVPARSHIAIRFRGRVVEQRGWTVGALLEFPPADVVGVVVHCLQLALPHCSLGFWPPPQHTCSLPQGPRESQALLTSFQLPPLTRVPDIPLLKTAYDPDTAAQCSLPSLLFLAVSGQKENTPGQATSSLYCLIGKKRTPRPRPLRVSLWFLLEAAKEITKLTNVRKLESFQKGHKILAIPDYSYRHLGKVKLYYYINWTYRTMCLLILRSKLYKSECIYISVCVHPCMFD